MLLIFNFYLPQHNRSKKKKKNPLAYICPLYEFNAPMLALPMPHEYR